MNMKKRIIATLLAAAMAGTMTVNVFADEVAPHHGFMMKGHYQERF